MYADTDSEGQVNVMLISEEELIQLIAEISCLKLTFRDYKYLPFLEQLRNHLVGELHQVKKYNDQHS
ncbi:hypothetical protein [Macellibacteroides fermentans]|uniref:hypothetical protein n=1 Tax=Macellibacteroides fermentans TaxID=879969 RepID=UPI00406C7E48